MQTKAQLTNGVTQGDRSRNPARALPRWHALRGPGQAAELLELEDGGGVLPAFDVRLAGAPGAPFVAGMGLPRPAKAWRGGPGYLAPL